MIVKKAIEKTGVQARTLRRRRDKLDAFVQTRAHTCTLHGVLGTPVSFELFAWGDLSQVFHVFFSRGHLTLKAKIMALAGRGAGLISLFASTYRPILLQLARSFDSSRRGVCVVQGRKRSVHLHATLSTQQVHGMALLTFMPSHRPMHACALKQQL